MMKKDIPSITFDRMWRNYRLHKLGIHNEYSRIINEIENYEFCYSIIDSDIVIRSDYNFTKAGHKLENLGYLLSDIRGREYNSYYAVECYIAVRANKKIIFEHDTPTNIMSTVDDIFERMVTSSQIKYT